MRKGKRENTPLLPAETSVNREGEFQLTILF